MDHGSLAEFSGHKGPVYALGSDPDPANFLSGSGDGTVVQWNIGFPENGLLLASVEQAVFSLAVIEARSLLIGTEGGDLHVVDLARRQELQLLRVHRRGIFRITGLSGGRIACAAGDGTVSIWHIAPDRSLKLLRHIPLSAEKIRDLAVSSDGGTMAVAAGDGHIRILETELFNEIASWEAHPGDPAIPSSKGCSCLAYHPAKPLLISGGKDGHLRSWHWGRDHAPVHSMAAHKGTIYGIAFQPGGGTCATAGRDRMIKLWTADAFDPLHRLDRAAGGHTHSVNAILWHNDRLISAGDDRMIKRWPDKVIDRS